MRICDVVCNSIWHDPRVNRQIVEYKKREDIQLTCVGLQCERYDPEKIKKIGADVRIVKVPDRYRGKLKTPVGKMWREHLRIRVVRDAIVEAKPDIIHANDLDALIPAMQAAKKLGCKVVFDSHELCAENGRTASNKLMHAYFSYYEKKLIGQCDRMVCVSHAAADYFVNKYQIPQPMVVTNSALSSYFPQEAVEKNPGFEVLNHGKYYGGRGYDILAKACTLLKDYPEIRLAVRGYGTMEEELRDIVAQSPNRDHFSFYPPVDVQDLIKMAARSHVGVAVTEPVCLNFELSISNKLFEYAAAGLPVILSSIPEHRYLNDKYHFGIVLEHNTPEDMAAAILKLYQDKALYSELAANAKRMAQEMNWETEFAQLIEAERQMMRA